MLAKLFQATEHALAFAAICVSALVAVYFGFLHYEALDSVLFVRDYGYYFMLAIFAGLLLQVVLFFRSNTEHLNQWRQRNLNLPFWVLLVVLTVFLVCSQSIGYKVVMDEVNLLGTSMGMHMDNKAQSVLRGYEINGSYLSLGGFVDKRPLFFPFIVSLLHDIFGYRTENAFYLNLVLIPVTLTLSYVLGCLCAANRNGGLLAMALVACFPLFNQAAHGGGFEVLNYSIIVWLCIAAVMYFNNPSKLSLNILCLSAVALANVRYESAVFVLPVALLVVLGWCFRREFVWSFGLIATPILMLPVPMLHRVFDLTPEHSWQLGSITDAERPFGFEYLGRNVEQALLFFFDSSHGYPNSLFLSAFGFVGCGLFAYIVIRNRGKSSILTRVNISMLMISVGVLCVMGLLLLYFWPFDDTVTRRLALPVLFLFTFPGIAAIGVIARKDLVYKILTVGALIVLLVEVAPREAKEIYTREYVHAQIANWKDAFAKEHAGQKVLVIDAPGVWITNKLSAIRRAQAIEKKDLLKFHIENESFDHIYLCQTYTKDYGMQVLRGDKYAQLDDSFVLEEVTSKTFNDVLHVKISEITDIDIEFPEELAERFKSAFYDTDISELSRSEQIELHVEIQRKFAALLP